MFEIFTEITELVGMEEACKYLHKMALAIISHLGPAMARRGRSGHGSTSSRLRRHRGVCPSAILEH